MYLLVDVKFIHGSRGLVTLFTLVPMVTRILSGATSLSLTVVIVPMTSLTAAASLSFATSEVKKSNCVTMLERLWLEEVE